MGENNGTFKKIVLIGLDNGGKTSILLSLQRNTNLLSYFSLNPTQGINIERFKDRGVEFSIWDFGGQEKYRRQYLEKLDEHFQEIDKVIFVIDIQDIDRYQIALEYLGKLVNHLKNNETYPDFSIFLHKFDPGLESDPEFTDEKISNNIVQPLKQLLPPDFKVECFKTSIYTVFQKRPIALI